MRVVLEIIVLPLLPCKGTRAVVLALPTKGFKGKDIAASNIGPKSTIYRIIKNFKERGSIVVRRVQGLQVGPASTRTVS